MEWAFLILVLLIAFNVRGDVSTNMRGQRKRLPADPKRYGRSERAW